MAHGPALGNLEGNPEFLPAVVDVRVRGKPAVTRTGTRSQEFLAGYGVSRRIQRAPYAAYIDGPRKGLKTTSMECLTVVSQEKSRDRSRRAHRRAYLRGQFVRQGLFREKCQSIGSENVGFPHARKRTGSQKEGGLREPPPDRPSKP